MKHALIVGLALLFTSSAPASGPENLLAGMWSGQYFYPGEGSEPVAFQLHIVPNGEERAFMGNTVEPNTFGDCSVGELTAGITGSTDEQGRFSFTKLYDGSGGQTHAVHYQGEISGNLQTARGTWCIEAFCGTFEMKRPLELH